MSSYDEGKSETATVSATKDIVASADNSEHDASVTKDRKPVQIHALYEVGFQVGFGMGIHSPIHENLTVASAINAKQFNSDGTWTGQVLGILTSAQYELIRGVFWNDDPNCQLFDDDPYGNKAMSIPRGLEYLKQFEEAGNGQLDHQNLLYRSHYGDLQFVHAMAATVGEQPSETQRKIKVWLQSMYLVYSGQNGVTPDTPVSSTELGQFFNGSNGHGSTTFKQLLMGGTPSFWKPIIGLRALGSCLHLIQDSCAKGHTRRDGDNGNGAVLNFHCYDGQDHDQHTHWDSKGGKGPLDPNKLDTLNGLFGGRVAIDRCVRFLNLAALKQPWGADLDSWFLDAFAVSPNATPADNSV